MYNLNVTISLSVLEHDIDVPEMSNGILDFDIL